MGEVNKGYMRAIQAVADAMRHIDQTVARSRLEQAISDLAREVGPERAAMALYASADALAVKAKRDA